MTRRLIAVVVVLLLIGLAAGPARADELKLDPVSVRKAVARVVAQAEPVHRAPRSKPMMWSGLAMAGGGATLAVLAGSALKTETCGAAVVGYYAVGACIEETNKGLLWTGIGLAAGGSTLAIIGAQPIVARGTVGLRKTVSF